MRVFEGQRVITKGGEVVTVALVQHGLVWAFSRNGLKTVEISCEAWGGDNDMLVV